MQSRINELIQKLNLIAHPEGGFYSETYRSSELTQQGNRVLSTSIYFLLTSTNVSNFHRIKSDEIWYFHEGSPLVVHTLSSEGHHEYKVGLNVSNHETPQLLVPKDTIFGSTVLEEDSYSLVSCSVAPGFEFEDFELFSTEELLSQFPDHKNIIQRLTR
jgi:predicted cupin superfamily sugar epimerase